MSGTGKAIQENEKYRPHVLYESWPGHIIAGYDGGDYLVIEDGPKPGQEFALFYVGRVGERRAAAALFGNMKAGSLPVGWQLVVIKPGSLTLQCGTVTRESLNFG
jgi:hypothetical protein